MNRHLMTLAVVLAGAAVLTSSPVEAGTLPGAIGLGGSWRKAERVPGTAVLNQGGVAGISSVSCASAGNCSAGGDYTDTSGAGQVFVVSQVNGTWGKAIEVPGSATLNTGGQAAITSMSCASAGNCSAGGDYFDSSGNRHGFVVSQVNGRWGKAEKVLHSFAIFSMSCASAGNCSAGGGYLDRSRAVNGGLVISQVNGTWGKAIEVPGTSTLSSVSCASAGNCSAGGDYTDSSGAGQVFVVSQINGTWGKAKQVPGSATLNTGGQAEIGAVSCGPAGNCSAGGDYFDSSGSRHAFVVSQVNGSWGKAAKVSGGAWIGSVSCASAGNCSAGGYDGSGPEQAFVVSQVNGTWGKAIEVPGSATLNTGGEAGIVSVSCTSAGNCSAGGYYFGSSGHEQAFVVSQVNGTWRAAIEVPGTATLNVGGEAGIVSVSCASASNCSAGGYYDDSSGHRQAFVVSQVNGT